MNLKDLFFISLHLYHTIATYLEQYETNFTDIPYRSHILTREYRHNHHYTKICPFYEPFYKHEKVPLLEILFSNPDLSKSRDCGIKSKKLSTRNSKRSTENSGNKIPNNSLNENRKKIFPKRNDEIHCSSIRNLNFCPSKNGEKNRNSVFTQKTVGHDHLQKCSKEINPSSNDPCTSTSISNSEPITNTIYLEKRVKEGELRHKNIQDNSQDMASYPMISAVERDDPATLSNIDDKMNRGLSENSLKNSIHDIHDLEESESTLDQQYPKAQDPVDSDSRYMCEKYKSEELLKKEQKIRESKEKLEYLRDFLDDKEEKVTEYESQIQSIIQAYRSKEALFEKNKQHLQKSKEEFEKESAFSEERRLKIRLAQEEKLEAEIEQLKAEKTVVIKSKSDADAAFEEIQLKKSKIQNDLVEIQRIQDNILDQESIYLAKKQELEAREAAQLLERDICAQKENEIEERKLDLIQKLDTIKDSEIQYFDLNNEIEQQRTSIAGLEKEIADSKARIREKQTFISNVMREVSHHLHTNVPYFIMDESEKTFLSAYKQIVRISTDRPILVFDLDNVLIDKSIQEMEREQHYTFLEQSGLTIQEISKILDFDDSTTQTSLKEFMMTLDIHSVANKIQKSNKTQLRDYLSTHIFTNISYDRTIQRNSELMKILNSISYRKFIFTNSPIDRAMKILEALDIVECFDGIMATNQFKADFCHVPMRESFECFEELFINLKKENLFYFTQCEKVCEKAEKCGWSPVECRKENLLEKLNEMFEKQIDE